MINDKVKGSIMILLGASCYGMLGVFVKIAYQSGYTTAEVTLAQFGMGFVVLLALNLFRRKARMKEPRIFSVKSKLHLIAAGISLGLTSIFYYLAVSYIPVSVCIVLLMQMVWMGVLLELFITKKIPEKRKIAGVITVIVGSVLATQLLEQSVSLNWKGILTGMLSALCYTATIYSTKNIKPEYSPVRRSLYMILGGLLMILIVFHSAVNQNFSYHLFFSWGILISLFGTVLPPLLFTAGMPLTGIGLGSILASVEIPVAVLASTFILEEEVSLLQWIGVILILVTVWAMNTRTLQKRN